VYNGLLMYNMVDDTSPVTLMPLSLGNSSFVSTRSLAGQSCVRLGLDDHVESNLCIIMFVIFFI